MTNFHIAKIRQEKPIKLIAEHVLIALFVIVISYWVGGLVGVWLG